MSKRKLNFIHYVSIHVGKTHAFVIEFIKGVYLGSTEKT